MKTSFDSIVDAYCTFFAKGTSRNRGVEFEKTFLILLNYLYVLLVHPRTKLHFLFKIA